MQGRYSNIRGILLSSPVSLIRVDLIIFNFAAYLIQRISTMISFDAESRYNSSARYLIFITIPAGFFTKKAGHTLKWQSIRMLSVASR